MKRRTRRKKNPLPWGLTPMEGLIGLGAAAAAVYFITRPSTPSAGTGAITITLPAAPSAAPAFAPIAVPGGSPIVVPQPVASNLPAFDPNASSVLPSGFPVPISNVNDIVPPGTV